MLENRAHYSTTRVNVLYLRSTGPIVLFRIPFSQLFLVAVHQYLFIYLFLFCCFVACFVNVIVFTFNNVRKFEDFLENKLGDSGAGKSSFLMIIGVSPLPIRSRKIKLI